MYIDNPVIMTSGNNQSYVIFGEPQYLDFQKDFAQKNAEKFTKEEKETEEDKNLTDIKEDEEEEDDNIDQGDIKDEDIQTLIDYSKCSRAKAIKTLK